MEDNRAQVKFQCGDFNNDESYWRLPDNQLELMSACFDEDCPESLWTGETVQENPLHVVSVTKPRPHRWVDGEVEHGYFVDIKLRESPKPATLVLVSQSMIQWNLKKAQTRRSVSLDNASSDLSSSKVSPPDEKIANSLLKEVIVIGPDLAWVEGVDDSVKVTYFDKDQLCAFPVAWEESKNPNNEFRRLFAALKEYTGLAISSFQGKSVGREFRVPFRSILAKERARQRPSRQLSSARSVFDPTAGIQWKRKGSRLVAKQFLSKGPSRVEKLPLPEKVSQAYFEAAEKKLYVINNHQFGTWDWKQGRFNAIHAPLKLPALYWPTALTFNPLTSELLVYNDDRGGEVYSYNVVTKKWKMFAKKVGYSLLALHFDVENERLIGAKFFGNKIDKWVEFDKRGRLLGSRSLSKPVEFTKRRWRAQLMTHQGELWLKVTHPAHPGGDIYPFPLAERSSKEASSALPKITN